MTSFSSPSVPSDVADVSGAGLPAEPEAILGYMVRGIESGVIEGRFVEGRFRPEGVHANEADAYALIDSQYSRQTHEVVALTERSASHSYQARVHQWLVACFGEDISKDRQERNHRFLEESLETVQSLGCTRSEAHQLVCYVFDRPAGEPRQEVGGAMTTLAALCEANDLDMMQSGELELARVWTKVEAIRAKQAAKPKHSALPMAVEASWNETPGPETSWEDRLAFYRSALKDETRHEGLAQILASQGNVTAPSNDVVWLCREKDAQGKWEMWEVVIDSDRAVESTKNWVSLKPDSRQIQAFMGATRSSTPLPDLSDIGSHEVGWGKTGDRG